MSHHVQVSMHVTFTVILQIYRNWMLMRTFVNNVREYFHRRQLTLQKHIKAYHYSQALAIENLWKESHYQQHCLNNKHSYLHSGFCLLTTVVSITSERPTSCRRKHNAPDCKAVSPCLAAGRVTRHRAEKSDVTARETLPSFQWVSGNFID